MYIIAARHPFPSVLENLSREALEDLQAEEETSAIYTESLNTNMYPTLDVCSVEIPKAEVVKGPSSDIPLIPIINFGNINDFNRTEGMIFNSSMNKFIFDRIHQLNHNIEILHMQPREYKIIKI